MNYQMPVAQIFDPSYWGGSKPAQAKSSEDPTHLNQLLVQWCVPVISATVGNINGRITVQVNLGINARCCLKNNHSQKD
jgi:hypothetical protein